MWPYYMYIQVLYIELSMSMLFLTSSRGRIYRRKAMIKYFSRDDIFVVIFTSSWSTVHVEQVYSLIGPAYTISANSALSDFCLKRNQQMAFKHITITYQVEVTILIGLITYLILKN